MAKSIKEKIDVHEQLRGAVDKGSWQCIVGKSFGSAITFETSYCLMIKLLPDGKNVCIVSMDTHSPFRCLCSNAPMLTGRIEFRANGVFNE